MSETDKAHTCPRCRGDGYFFQVPNGFNPFLAGAIQTANASYRVNCWCEAGKARSTLEAVDGKSEH